jgi:hypothetical protein
MRFLDPSAGNFEGVNVGDRPIDLAAQKSLPGGFKIESCAAADPRA